MMKIIVFFFITLFSARFYLDSSSPQRWPASLKSPKQCSALARELLIDQEVFASDAIALRERIPNFDQRMALVESKLFTPKSFANEFKQEHGRYPTVKKTVDHLVKEHKALIAAVKALGEGLEDDHELQHYIVQTVELLERSDREVSNINEFFTEYAHLSSAVFDPKNGEIMQKMSWLWKNPFGAYGELSTAMRFPGVEAMGLSFRMDADKVMSNREVFHRDLIRKAVEDKVSLMEGYSNKQLAKLKKQYPHVLNFSTGREFNRLRSWFFSKEIDLIVRRGDGVYYLMEVKNYSRKLTAEKIANDPHGGKSILDQQKELIEMIDFLEIGDQYSPAIHFLKGVDEEAETLLKEAGIKLIH